MPSTALSQTSYMLMGSMPMSSGVLQHLANIFVDASLMAPTAHLLVTSSNTSKCPGVTQLIKPQWTVNMEMRLARV